MLTESSAMARALELAWRGWGRVAPNPMVGCVLLQDGIPVGEGWHAEDGGAHAERVALDAAGDRARGATAVVTLEPCVHQGRQPPCSEALIAAGIARVVVATADPNPIAAGGAAQLRAAGIPVEFGLMADDARRMNAPFFHRYSSVDRPWTMLKLALSLDGRIADAAGRSRWISGAAARDWVHWLRAGFDAVGVGGATARIDDPLLTPRGRVVPRIPPRRVVFAGRAGLPATLQVVRGAPETGTIIVAHPDAAGRADWERAGASTIETPDLREAMRQLRQAGIASLLVEGGGRLAGALLAERLVDRCAMIQAPIFLGEAGVPAVAGLRPALPDVAPWQVVERRALGVDTLLTLEPA